METMATGMSFMEYYRWTTASTARSMVAYPETAQMFMASI
jgi:hypothetical protein